MQIVFFYFSAFSAPATGSRKYTVITCYQLQAWSWSFTLLVSSHDLAFVNCDTD